MGSVYEYTPSVYALQNDPANPHYPIFKSEVATFCDEVNDAAQRVINRSTHFTINDFIPKLKFRFFGAFSSTTINGERRDSDEMDGAGRAFSVVAGGLVAAVASFVFGSFYNDYQEACIRLERCENFRENFPEVWQIHHHEHIKDIKLVADSEEKIAKAEKRSAMINMALTIGVIAAGAILIVAGLFASIPLALGAVVLMVTICIVAMAKFGMNFFDKMPARRCTTVEAAINRLKAARDPYRIQRSYGGYTSYMYGSGAYVPRT